MKCLHPIEEQQRVYEGSPIPRSDRLLCGLCGDLIYLDRPPAAVPAPHQQPVAAANAAVARR